MTTALASLLITGMTVTAMLCLLTPWPPTTPLVLCSSRHTSPPSDPPSSPRLPLAHRTRGGRDPPRDRRARAPPPLQRVRPGGSRPTPDTHLPQHLNRPTPRGPADPNPTKEPTPKTPADPPRGSTFTR